MNWCRYLFESLSWNNWLLYHHLPALLYLLLHNIHCHYRQVLPAMQVSNILLSHGILTFQGLRAHITEYWFYNKSGFKRPFIFMETFPCDLISDMAEPVVANESTQNDLKCRSASEFCASCSCGSDSLAFQYWVAVAIKWTLMEL